MNEVTDKMLIHPTQIPYLIKTINEIVALPDNREECFELEGLIHDYTTKTLCIASEKLKREWDNMHEIFKKEVLKNKL